MYQLPQSQPLQNSKGCLWEKGCTVSLLHIVDAQITFICLAMEIVCWVVNLIGSESESLEEYPSQLCATQFIEVGLCCRCLLAPLSRFGIGGLSRLIYRRGEHNHCWEEPSVVGRLSRQCCAIPSCPWGYRLGFHSFSHASLAPVVFQYVPGSLENCSECFSSEQRKAKVQARLLCSEGLEAVKWMIWM